MSNLVAQTERERDEVSAALSGVELRHCLLVETSQAILDLMTMLLLALTGRQQTLRRAGQQLLVPLEVVGRRERTRVAGLLPADIQPT